MQEKLVYTKKELFQGATCSHPKETMFNLSLASSKLGCCIEKMLLDLLRDVVNLLVNFHTVKTMIL